MFDRLKTCCAQSNTLEVTDREAGGVPIPVVSYRVFMLFSLDIGVWMVAQQPPVASESVVFR